MSEFDRCALSLLLTAPFHRFRSNGLCSLHSLTHCSLSLPLFTLLISERGVRFTHPLFTLLMSERKRDNKPGFTLGLGFVHHSLVLMKPI